MDALPALQAGLTPEAFSKIALAVLYGGAIGLEREARGRAAGFRTMILVCLGATLVTMVAASLVEPATPGGVREEIVRVDPGRIAAGIVTGVGFLGAAVVIKLGDLVRGVTTAATIWFAAVLGIVIGQGSFGLASVVTLVALLVLWGFNFIEKRVQGAIYRTVTLHVDAEQADRTHRQAAEVIRSRGMRVMDLHASQDATQSVAQLAFHVRTTQKLQAHDVVARLAAVEGVQRVEWH